MIAALILSTMNIVGQMPDQGAASLAPPGTFVGSVWDFVVKGGSLMVPISLSSLIGLTIVIERLISLRRTKVIPPGFIAELKRLLNDERRGKDAALRFCRENGSPIASVFEVGIRTLGNSVELLEKRIQEAGERVVLKLRKYLRGLSVIASIAPLMGLLGTIFGMIKAFQTVADSAAALGRTELLAEGIYEALITTAAGLLVAIPVIVCYHWISAKIDVLVGEIDVRAVEFIEEYAQGTHLGMGMGSVDERSDNGKRSIRAERPVEAVFEASAPGG